MSELSYLSDGNDFGDDDSSDPSVTHYGTRLSPILEGSDSDSDSDSDSEFSGPAQSFFSFDNGSPRPSSSERRSPGVRSSDFDTPRSGSRIKGDWYAGLSSSSTELGSDSEGYGKAWSSSGDLKQDHKKEWDDLERSSSSFSLSQDESSATRSRPRLSRMRDAVSRSFRPRTASRRSKGSRGPSRLSSWISRRINPPPRFPLDISTPSLLSQESDFGGDWYARDKEDGFSSLSDSEEWPPSYQPPLSTIATSADPRTGRPPDSELSTLALGTSEDPRGILQSAPPVSSETSDVSDRHESALVSPIGIGSTSSSPSANFEPPPQGSIVMQSPLNLSLRSPSSGTDGLPTSADVSDVGYPPLTTIDTDFSRPGGAAKGDENDRDTIPSKGSGSLATINTTRATPSVRRHDEDEGWETASSEAGRGSTRTIQTFQPDSDEEGWETASSDGSEQSRVSWVSRSYLPAAGFAGHTRVDDARNTLPATKTRTGSLSSMSSCGDAYRTIEEDDAAGPTRKRGYIRDHMASLEQRLSSSRPRSRLSRSNDNANRLSRSWRGLTSSRGGGGDRSRSIEDITEEESGDNSVPAQASRHSLTTAETPESSNPARAGPPPSPDRGSIVTTETGAADGNTTFTGIFRRQSLHNAEPADHDIEDVMTPPQIDPDVESGEGSDVESRWRRAIRRYRHPGERDTAATENSRSRLQKRVGSSRAGPSARDIWSSVIREADGRRMGRRDDRGRQDSPDTDFSSESSNGVRSQYGTYSDDSRDRSMSPQSRRRRASPSSGGRPPSRQFQDGFSDRSESREQFPGESSFDSRSRVWTLPDSEDGEDSEMPRGESDSPPRRATPSFLSNGGVGWFSSRRRKSRMPGSFDTDSPRSDTDPAGSGVSRQGSVISSLDSALNSGFPTPPQSPEHPRGPPAEADAGSPRGVHFEDILHESSGSRRTSRISRYARKLRRFSLSRGSRSKRGTDDTGDTGSDSAGSREEHSSGKKDRAYHAERLRGFPFHNKNSETGGTEGGQTGDYTEPESRNDDSGDSRARDRAYYAERLRGFPFHNRSPAPGTTETGKGTRGHRSDLNPPPRSNVGRSTVRSGLSSAWTKERVANERIDATQFVRELDEGLWLSEPEGFGKNTKRSRFGRPVGSLVPSVLLREPKPEQAKDKTFWELRQENPDNIGINYGGDDRRGQKRMLRGLV